MKNNENSTLYKCHPDLGALSTQRSIIRPSDFVKKWIIEFSENIYYLNNQILQI